MTSAFDERRVRRQREHDRQPRQHRFEPLPATLGALDADVDVQAVHALPLRDVPEALNHLEVALFLHDRQRRERRGRVRACGGDHEAVVACNPVCGSAQHPQCLDRLVDVGADVRRQLDDVGVQLCLQRPRQVERLGSAHEHVNGGCRLERLGVEDHHLFLDTE